MSDNQKKHFHLATGTIIFAVPNEEEQDAKVGNVTMNVMLMTSDGLIRHKEIGKLQQMLQMRFHKEIGDPTAQVVDVVINNISFLGVMTDEEFNVPPEGMALQEAPKDVVPSILQ